MQFAMILRYVADPIASAEFYAAHFGATIFEKQPTFCALGLVGGVKLGLWRRDGVAPEVKCGGVEGELAFAAPSDLAVDEIHARWRAAGLVIAQAPTRMDFAYTATALDPDGLRVRIMGPMAD
jgi:predicted enzyme related to lactoylglutathione lyase